MKKLITIALAVLSLTAFAQNSPLNQGYNQAVLCHKSQDPQEILDEWHAPMERFRGNESECTYAEAFMVLHKTRN